MLNYISQLPSKNYALTRPRSLSILGSTGSIGQNSLRVVEACSNFFEIVALSGGKNIQLLLQQALRWRPKYLGVLTEALAQKLAKQLPADYQPEIKVGQHGYIELATLPQVSTVLSAQVGAAGLAATWAAVAAGKVVCLANKESLVLAGDLLRQLCSQTGGVILPVDSEHGAIFQAIVGRNPAAIRKIILTASGGPFWGKDLDFLATVTPKQALAHPSWNMGAKISIDSATMMNKGLEVLEAYHLFALDSADIEVLVHPKSIVHSLVEFQDNTLMAQLGIPDMRLPIAHCLTWPETLPQGVPSLDLASLGALTFAAADLYSFPCLGLAREVLGHGSELAITLNAANEVAVDAFLQHKLDFLGIPRIIAQALEKCTASTPKDLSSIEAIDTATRQLVSSWLHLN